VLLKRFQWDGIGREQGDEFLVGGQEIIFRQRRGIGPLEPFKHQILQRGGTVDVRLKENQFERGTQFAVAIMRAEEFVADGGFDAEFLAQFALQCFLGSFTGLDFAAGRVYRRDVSGKPESGRRGRSAPQQPSVRSSPIVPARIVMRRCPYLFMKTADLVCRCRFPGP